MAQIKTVDGKIYDVKESYMEIKLICQQNVIGEGLITLNYDVTPISKGTLYKPVTFLIRNIIMFT